MRMERLLVNTFPYLPIFVKEVEGEVEREREKVKVKTKEGKEVLGERATFRNTKFEFFFFFVLSNFGFVASFFFYLLFLFSEKVLGFEASFPYSFSLASSLAPLSFLGFLLIFRAVLTPRRTFPLFAFSGLISLLFLSQKQLAFLFSEVLTAFLYALILTSYKVVKVNGVSQRGYYIFFKE